MMRAFLKNVLKKTVLRPNRVYPILKGPLRGSRFKVTLNTEWAPIVGNWEPESQYLFTRLIRSGQVIFDLGANTGIHTLLFAKLAGAGGRVIAFEPLASNVAEIVENLALNGLTNVTIEPLAIADYEGEGVFQIARHPKRGSLRDSRSESGGTAVVAVTTLDAYTGRHETYPDFVKIDIEGAEQAAVAGFDRHVTKTCPILHIECHDVDNESAVHAFLRKHDYLVYRQTPDAHNDLGLRHLTTVTGTERLFPNDWRGNGTVIAIHRSKVDATRDRRP